MADTDGSLNPHYDTVKTPWSRATNFVSNPFVILALIVAVTFFVAIVHRQKKFFHRIIKNHVGRARSRKREYKCSESTVSNPEVVVDVETDADDDDDVVDDNDGDDHDEDPDEGEDSFDGSVESSAPLSADKRRRRPGLLEQRALASGSFERIVAVLPKPKAPAKATFSLKDGDDHEEDPDEGEDSFDGSVESSAALSADKRRRRPGLLKQRSLASGSFQRIVAALPKPKAPAKPTFSLRRAFSLNDSAAWQNERCFLQRKLS